MILGMARGEQASKKPPAISAVNMIVGAEEFLAERQRFAIVHAARKKAGNPELPVELHKATNLSEPQLIELLSPSLFAEDRIVVISGVADCGKETVALLKSAIETPADGVVLILLHSGKGRNKRLVNEWQKLGVRIFPAEPLRPRERRSFVEQEFRSYGVSVGPEVVDRMLDSVGSDLRELASAVSQLVADTDANVTPDAVQRYYQGQAEVTGFDIADLVLAGRQGEAVAAARRAIQLGVPLVLIASALSTAMRDVARVAGAGRIDPRRDASAFGMAPWKLEKTLRVARQWPPAAVSRGVQLVAQLDAGVKGQLPAPEYAVEDTVRQLAGLIARR